MVKLYLIRHGETTHNVNHIWGGNPELTEEGERQAREITEYLKSVKYKIIYHSPRKRAVKTAEIIAESSDIKLVKVAELTEMDYGRLEGLSIEESEKKFPGMKPKGATALYYGKIGGRIMKILEIGLEVF